LPDKQVQRPVACDIGLHNEKPMTAMQREPPLAGLK